MRRYTVEVDGQSYVIDVQEQSRDTFTVRTGDRDFDVQLTSAEDVAEAIISPAFAVHRPAGPPAPYRPPAPETLPPLAPTHPPRLPSLLRPGGQGVVTTPMPGLVVSVLVEEGDHVTRGDALVHLEAMKMINAIRASDDAVVAEVLVAEGQQVGYGAPLVRLAGR
jgi:biotin carboxyl carrier protein